MKTNLLKILPILCCMHCSVAQENDHRAELEEIADKVSTYYIHGEMATQLSEKLHKEIAKGTFAHLSNQVFADSLTSFLTSQSNDLHFNILYRPEHREKKIDEKELLRRYDAINRQFNYGFEKVERLDGNIGYIKYVGFPEGNANSGEILASVMNMLQNTHALIIDLRDNRGGDHKMVEMFLGYFFKERTLLSTHYSRYNKSKSKSFTHRPSGKRYLDRPLYILVNNNTISAAEALAYNLQQFGKATVLGTQTYGAANPVKAFFVGDQYHVFIPVTEEINSRSGTNWEHKGLDLDIGIAEEKALTKAHMMALEYLIEHNVVMELETSEAQRLVEKLQSDL